MMNGATIPRPTIALKTAEATTIAASQSQTGIRPMRIPKLDLGETPGNLPRLGCSWRDAHVRRGLTHLPQYRVPDRVSAGCFLERCRVEIRDPLQVVLAPRELRGRGSHLVPYVLARHEELEAGFERPGLDLVDRHLQRDVAGQLGEPAHVADDEGLTERERTDDASGRLPHRGMAKIHAGVDSRHQRPQPPLVHPALPDEPLVREAEPLEAAVEVEPR
jgi:hypothetical protein